MLLRPSASLRFSAHAKSVYLKSWMRHAVISALRHILHGLLLYSWHSVEHNSIWRIKQGQRSSIDLWICKNLFKEVAMLMTMNTGPRQNEWETWEEQTRLVGLMCLVCCTSYSFWWSYIRLRVWLLAMAFCFSDRMPEVYALWLQDVTSLNFEIIWSTIRGISRKPTFGRLSMTECDILAMELLVVSVLVLGVCWEAKVLWMVVNLRCRRSTYTVKASATDKHRTFVSIDISRPFYLWRSLWLQSDIIHGHSKLSRWRHL